MEKNTNPQVFVPAIGVRHRPLKTKNKKKPKKGMANVYKTMHVCLGRQLKEGKAILAGEDVPIDCCPPYSQRLPKKNFLEVVFLAALGERKCQGFKGKFKEQMPAPKDLVFTCRCCNYGRIKN